MFLDALLRGYVYRSVIPLNCMNKLGTSRISLFKSFFLNILNIFVQKAVKVLLHH
jgi:hypothetical protein